MNNIPRLVNHIEVELLLGSTDNRESLRRRAEHCAFGGTHLACKRGGCVDNIVDTVVAASYMLEVVDMSAYVHSHLVFISLEDGEQA